MPPVTEFIKAGMLSPYIVLDSIIIMFSDEGDEDDSDDDLEMGGVTQNFNCPITLTPLVNPVTSYVVSFRSEIVLNIWSRSRVCNHSFSAASIKDYCKVAQKEYSCPAAGCNKRFKLADCIPDERLAKKAEAHQRRQRRAAEDSDDDDDEVID